MPIVTILSATVSYPDLPAPLTPPDCDLKGMPYMPLVVDRLWRSKAWVRAKAKPELGFYLINLWSAAFFSVPAASLEDDDELLCDLAMCDPGRWAGVRADVLRGWTKCSDGRLYHQEVADRALEAWKGRKGYRDRLEAARNAKKAKAEAAKHGELSMQTAAGTETAKPADEAKPNSMIEPITDLSQAFKVQGTRYKDREEERETPLRESGPAGRGTAPATNAQLDILEPDKVVALRQPSAASEAAEAIAAYNVVASQRGLSQASPRQSPARLASLRLRLRDLGGMEGWHVAMDRLAEADFIKYDWSGFSFGLMLRAETMNRLMEGTYKQRKRSKDGYHSAADVRASGERVKARYAEMMKTMEG